MGICLLCLYIFYIFYLLQLHIFYRQHMKKDIYERSSVSAKSYWYLLYYLSSVQTVVEDKVTG